MLAVFIVCPYPYDTDVGPEGPVPHIRIFQTSDCQIQSRPLLRANVESQCLWSLLLMMMPPEDPSQI